MFLYHLQKLYSSFFQFFFGFGQYDKIIYIVCQYSLISFGLNSPLFVKNATFYLSPSLICMLLYFLIRFSLLKYFISLSLSITSLIISCPLLYAGSTFCSSILAIEICSSLECKNIMLYISNLILL